jgi:hypothetical protein
MSSCPELPDMHNLPTMKQEKSIQDDDRQPIVAPYADARRHIRDGDLLSFRPRCTPWMPWTYSTWLIALTNRHHICHSAMAAWWGDNLMCVQMTASPGRIVRLSELVRRWPGKITVSRAFPKPTLNYQNAVTFNRKKAVEVMVRIASRPYGWWRLLLMGLSHTLLGVHLFPPSENDWEKSKWPPVCSQSVSMATRAAGADPCQNVADRSTEPHDLYESEFYEPLYTMVP